MVGIQRYVDVNVFVYWLGKHPSFGETAYNWIKDIEDSPGREYTTSTLTPYQVLLTITTLSAKSLKDAETAKNIIDSFTSLRGLSLEDLTQEDYIEAPRLMKKYRLDFEDALHTSVAIRLGAKEIISNDKDLDRAPIKRIF
ncbi:MAG: type II toxin-antitoxin system VapC family toxin [Thaumarchaeota archaeon]|nr:type II toxin-antitoxin system VapC family toxin [Nitrososphaerota archaeon]